MKGCQRGRHVTMLALFCCLLLLASCGLSLFHESPQPNSPPDSAVSIVIDPSISYADVLRGLTNLGVQPAVFCGYQRDIDAGEVIESAWLPAGQQERFQQEHRMFVMKTLDAPTDWVYQMHHLPGVRNDPSLENIFCSGGHSTIGPTPQPGAPAVLTLNPADRHPLNSEIGTYAYVTFASGVDYDIALYDVSNLGLRLADPCYEYSLLPHHQPKQWHPMSQEITFSYAHALVVAPAPLISAVTWRDQLHKLPDVTTVDTSYHPVC